MKVGGTDFNIEAVKQMSLKAFCSTYPNLKGIDSETAYFLITGKTRRKKKKGGLSDE